MTSESVRDAILLVAGVGARLRPLTEAMPKCLLQIDEVPLLLRLLRQITSLGIERVVLATGYMHETIRVTLSGYSDLPELRYAFNPHFAETNNAQSLCLALPYVEGRPFLLCDGDVLLHEVKQLRALLEVERENALMMIARDDVGDEEMKIRLVNQSEHDNTRIAGLSKKLNIEHCHGESLGLQKIGRTTLPALYKRLASLDVSEQASLYYEDVFAELIDEGHPFFAVTVPANCWTEIDTVGDYEHAQTLFRQWQQPDKYLAEVEQ